MCPPRPRAGIMTALYCTLVPVAVLGKWQLLQASVMPWWFIAVPAKLVKLVLLWQVSQVRAVAKWLATLVTRLPAAAGPWSTTVAKPWKAGPLWHCAQLLLMPVWSIAALAKPRPLFLVLLVVL